MNKTAKLQCCLILVMILLLPSAYARQTTDPFEPKLNIILDENQPQPLFPEPSKPKTDPFKLGIRAIPGKIAPGKNFMVEVMFTIAPGYQLYARETSVTAIPAPGLIFGDVKQISQAFEKKDQFRGAVLIYKKKAIFELPVTVEPSVESGPKQISLEVRYLGCTETMCFLPQKKKLEVAFTVVPGADPVAAENPEQAISDNSMAAVEQNPFQDMADRFGILGVLAAAFIWGILASLTPCVYPMIPVTVSVIGAGSHGSVSRGFILSLFYVLGLSLTYAILGAIAAWSGSLFGAYTNHPAVRVIVAGVFVILALSMFDLFHIQMPSSISSKLGGGTGSGFVGVFLTGAAAGAVVSPCVGPMLVALLIYIAAIGSKLKGFLIMWNFALGMGMLFLVIGTFSGAAASLPKAGMWMEKLKRFFGVLMLGVALYYVEPLLPENVFMLSLGTFLMGIGVFAGAFDALNAQSSGRERLWKTIGILFLVLGIGYVARFTLDDQMPRAVSQKSAGITWLNNEAYALAQAKQEKKPVMIDFSAEWCAACKKLERETFTDSSVINKSKQFVCLKIDCTDTENPAVRDIQKKYNVVGLPTIFFINALGQPLPDKSVTEFIGPSDLMKQMYHVEQSQ